ncbi:MAG: hypothetical protein DYG90_09735, partial [Chloroflexi bacterium CFX6]|nr:hypothetical protein [Chloroflexi bacterium CFX6]
TRTATATVPPATATRTPTPTTAGGSPTATATPQSSSFGAAHDAHVKNTSPDTNYGAVTNLRVRSGSPGYNTYLKFTVTGLTGTVVRARIRLFAYDGGPSAGAMHTVSNDDGGGTPWTESTLTWNNAPAIGGNPLSTVGTVGNNEWAEWDVTSAVSGNGTFSFGLQNNSTNSVNYQSKEASGDRPVLVVDTVGGNTPPPPSPSPTASRTATAVPTLTLTSSPTATATASVTRTRTPTPTVTGTPPTNTPSPTGPTPTNTRTPTAAASATATRTGTPTPVPLWISRNEIQALPTSGTPWANVINTANSYEGSPTVCNQDSPNNVMVLAKALAYVRTGNQTFRTRVRDNVMNVIGTENGSTCRSLALGRKLAAYVISAELVGLTSSEETTFRNWLTSLRTRRLNGDNRSLVECHEERPNNWGTMCGGSRAAASAYLGDRTDLDRTAQVFKGYLGDRSSYAGFSYGSDQSWHADPNALRGINPQGSVKQGVNIDGVLPDDMRRGGSFRTGCPVYTGYPWEALQGVMVQAEILHRQGYNAWGWENQAERRAVQYLKNLYDQCGGNWYGDTDDEFTPWMINHVYGTSFPTASPVHMGKIMGWTDWTHDRATRPRQ